MEGMVERPGSREALGFVSCAVTIVKKKIASAGGHINFMCSLSHQNFGLLLYLAIVKHSTLGESDVYFYLLSGDIPEL